MAFVIDFERAGVHNLSFDIDHNGAYLYIAALDSLGDPHIFKMSTDMEQDAEIVHSPSASALMVQCGRNSDRIWAAGSAGIIKYDGIAGQYWEADGFTTTWNIQVFHLGPDDDELILVFNDFGEVWESYFLQNYFDTEWFELNENTNFTTFCVDRLDTSQDEFLIGCNYFYLGGVMYSPNAAYDFQLVNNNMGDQGVQATSVIFL